MDRGADAGARQRPLAGPVRRGCTRRVRIHRRGVDRPVRQLAPRGLEKGRCRAGGEERAARRGRTPSRGRRAREGRCPGRQPAHRRNGWCAGGRHAPAGPARGAGADRSAGNPDGAARRPLARHPVRTRAAGDGRARTRSLWRMVRDVSALGRPGSKPQRHVRGSGRSAPVHRGDGFRRALPSAHPSHRPELSKGPEQHSRSRAGRCGEPVGDRGGGRRARCRGTRTWNDRGLRSLHRSGAPSGSRGGAGPCVPGVSRSPLRPPAPRMVPPAARRHDQVRREPAEEVPGHLPDQFRVAGMAGALAGAQTDRRVLDRARREDLPGGQSAHQALPVLGVGAGGDQEGASRNDFSGGGVHPSESDALPRQVRLLAVIHVFHVANRERRDHRVLHRADQD